MGYRRSFGDWQAFGIKPPRKYTGMHPDILVRNNVRISGSGTRPLLFAHGFGCDQNMWRYVVPAFEADHRVILFDYVGSGKSDPRAFNAERYGDLNGYAEDMLDVIHALDLKNVTLVAHSVSGMIGLISAIREPTRFDRLILVSPSPCYINDVDYVGGFGRKDIDELLETMESNYIGWANFMAPVVMRNADRPELPEELTESFCSTDPVMARHFAKATFLSDNRGDLQKLTVPALILQCTDDLIAPVEVGTYMHRSMQSSSLEMIEASGHCPHMSDPELVIAAMRSYLAAASFSEA